MNSASPARRRDGFTLIELMLAVLITALLSAGIFKIFGTCKNIQSSGMDLSDAQQNARIAKEALEKDLRLAGYGIPGYVETPVIVASEYRVTFVKDLNDNGLLDLGETITYFVDPNTETFMAAVTPNPRDMVLRRVASDALNPNADPISGYGDVVASNITQQVDGDGYLDVPLFGYFDDQGNSLVDFASLDPFSGALGRTVSDSTLLGRPPGGAKESAIATISITVITEGEAPDQFLKNYHRVLLSTAVAPRNLPVNLR
jgi:prepilin-type N-terminal cleavage/methylation domain-containing protein